MAPTRPGGNRERAEGWDLRSPRARGGAPDNDELVRLINRGKDPLSSGDLAAARLLFERAADAGGANAAVALGSTMPMADRRIQIDPD